MSKFSSPGAKLLLVANLAHFQITLFNFSYIKETQIVCLHDMPVDTFSFSRLTFNSLLRLSVWDLAPPYGHLLTNWPALYINYIQPPTPSQKCCIYLFICTNKTLILSQAGSERLPLELHLGKGAADPDKLTCKITIHHAMDLLHRVTAETEASPTFRMYFFPWVFRVLCIC